MAIGDDLHRWREDGCGRDVVDVLVTVDEVGDGLVGHLGNGLEVIRAEAGWCIAGNHASRRDGEHSVICAVRNPIKPAPTLVDNIAFAAQGGAPRYCAREVRKRALRTAPGCASP